MGAFGNLGNRILFVHDATKGINRNRIAKKTRTANQTRFVVFVFA